MQNATIFYLICMLIFVSNSLFCGVVRWFHVCAPYQNDPDYYYPARKQIAILFFGTAMLIPCVFHILGHDALLYARCFGVIWYPMMLNLVITSFINYTSKPKLENLEKSTLAFSTVSMSIIVACNVDWLVDHQRIVEIYSLTLYIYGMVRQLMKLFNLSRMYFYDMGDKVSSLDDIKPFFLISSFPLFFITEIPLLVAFLLDNPTVQGSVFLLMTVVNTSFLIAILHSQKEPRFRIVTSDSLDLNNSSESANSEILIDDQSANIVQSPDEIAMLLERVEKVLEEKELYRNPHLTINELAEEVGAHPLSVREACKRNYKNFFDLVNTYRLKFAKEYVAKHPYAKRETVAFESGFGSYRSYLRVESKMDNFESVL